MRKIMIAIILSLLLSVIYANETMTIVYYENYAPYSWRDENGEMRGLLIDVMDRSLRDEMGIALIHEGYPWARSQLMVEKGEADALVTVDTPARREYTIISDEYAVISYCTIFTRKDHPELEAFRSITKIDESLNPYLLLDYVGNGWGDQNLGQFNRYLTVRMDNVFQMLAAGRGDMFITGTVEGNYTVKKLGLEDIIIEIPNVLDVVKFHLCVGKSSPFTEIVEQFDETILLLRDKGALDEIYAKYK